MGLVVRGGDDGGVYTLSPERTLTIHTAAAVQFLLSGN